MLADERNAAEVREPRICMPSWRNFKKPAYQGALYEAQDVLAEVDEVDLLCPEPGRTFHFLEYWQRRLLWKDVTKRLAYVNPGLRPVHLKRDYDLFVAVCQSWWDILYLNAIKGIKDHCRTSVCWFDELWAAWVPEYGCWLHTFAQFDHVVLAMGGSVEAVGKALGRQCEWVPYGVDTVRFSPYPDPPHRVVDVYSIGRRWDGLHRSFLKLAQRGEIFYVYDTFPGSMAHPPDHREHRDLIANIAKRSRYFVVGPAKLDRSDDTRGQVEIGSRYFEGAASGAVMLGQAADCESFRHLFGWRDSVIPVQTDGSDIADVLADLSGQAERLRGISHTNVRESLLRHDWVYRWRRILEIAGLKPRQAMDMRERKLRQRSELTLPEG